MLVVSESVGVRYPYRVTVTDNFARSRAFRFWHREKERIDCGFDDALEASTLLFSKRSDAEFFASSSANAIGG